MPDEDAPVVEELNGHDNGDPETVLVRTNPFAAMGRAAGSPTALALAGLIVATATMLSMQVTNDFAAAKYFSSRGFDDVTELRWQIGVRLVVAVVGLLLAVASGIRYARRPPPTRYTGVGHGPGELATNQGGRS